MRNGFLRMTASMFAIVCLLAGGAKWAAGQNGTVTATTRALTVLSVNPERGVPIAVEPLPTHMLNNPLTPFSLVYPVGTTVTLTAPALLGDPAKPVSRFVAWQNNGATIQGGTNLMIRVVMREDHRLTAVYEAIVPPPPPTVTTHTLTVGSINPPQGVLIAVQPLPVGVQLMMPTPFTQVYAQGTTVVLTAPEIVPFPNGGQARFVQWIVGSLTLYWPHPAITVVLNADQQLTAVYEITPPPPPPVTTHTLSVLSVNPERGVPIATNPLPFAIAVIPATPFSFVYAEGTTVTLTAPATLGDSSKPISRFVKWLRNGQEFSGGTNTVTKVIMKMDHTMTAVYEAIVPPPPPPVTTHTLTVMSVHPERGVPIAVEPNPMMMPGNPLTPFTLVFPEGTTVTLSAPATLGDPAGTQPGVRFAKWLRNGQEFNGGTNSVTKVILMMDHTMTAVYEAIVPPPPPPVTTHTLTVLSVNPERGVQIAVGPQNAGTPAHLIPTPFSLVLPDGTTTTLTAPQTLSGPNGSIVGRFVKWLRNGAEFDRGAHPMVSVVMLEDTRMTAVYESAPPPPPPAVTHTLSVGSVNPERGVPIAVQPMPVTSQPMPDGMMNNPTTPFSFAYPEGTTVTLAAPAMLPGASGAINGRFVKWLKDGKEFNGGANPRVVVIMNADQRMIAVYESAPPPPPPPSVTTYTLTVLSSNPEHGVPIIVLASSDASVVSSRLTPFAMVYQEGARVTLSAPGVLPGAPGIAVRFARWLKDGWELDNGDAPSITVAMDADHEMTAVYEEVADENPCPLTLDSAVPDCLVSIAIQDPSGLRDLMATFNGVRAGSYDYFTTISLTAGSAKDARYTFRKWLRNGEDFEGNQSPTIEIELDGPVAMTAVYASAWFEDYIIAYSDNSGNKFVHPAPTSPTTRVADGVVLSAENGLLLMWDNMTSATFGNLNIRINRAKVAQNALPRPIPAIKTKGSLARLWSQATVACKGSGGIQAAGALRSATMVGAYALNLSAEFVGEVRMESRPAGSSVCVTAIHARGGMLEPRVRPAVTAPAMARPAAMGNINLVGVSLAQLTAPNQPVSVMTQTRRPMGAMAEAIEAGIGLGEGSIIQAAVVARLAAIGGSIRCAAILSQAPAAIVASSVNPYPNKSVTILSRALPTRNRLYAANIAVKEINVEGSLRIVAEGGDIGNIQAPSADAIYPARIIAGGRILGISASTVGGAGGYIGVRSAAADPASTSSAAPIAVVAGANPLGEAVMDIGAVMGAAGVNGVFFAGAFVADDPAFDIIPMNEGGNIGAIQSRARRPNAVMGGAWLNDIGAQRLVRQLKAQINVSGDFAVNGTPLSQW